MAEEDAPALSFPRRPMAGAPGPEEDADDVVKGLTDQVMTNRFTHFCCCCCCI